ncbi:uncharacterized protein LOC107042528 [Diachasma alloeum]|uniref:uncharacterized protein LOC107042528 n=1 Tax=Diachasma alloeum TaxID=454923 RepID=UPI0007381C9C|nr:uncharacterized protein LOC107042528 [Diachasma alloeum]
MPRTHEEKPPITAEVSETSNGEESKGEDGENGENGEDGEKIGSASAEQGTEQATVIEALESSKSKPQITKVEKVEPRVDALRIDYGIERLLRRAGKKVRNGSDLPDDGYDLDEDKELEARIENLLKRQWENLRREEQSQSSDSTGNSTAKEVVEVAGPSVKRDYKLNISTRYEHFYDYSKSEVRTHTLLHVLDSIIEFSRDQKPFDEHKFKEEVSRKQSGEGISEVRAANLTGFKERYFECEDYGHLGRNCPGKGTGRLCDGCKGYGNIIKECPNSSETNNKPKFNVRHTNSRGSSFRGFGRGGGSLKRRSIGSGANDPKGVKKGKYYNLKGKEDNQYSKPKTSTKSNKEGSSKTSGGDNK